MLALVFVAGFVLPYLSLNEARFDRFWPQRWWLLAHLSTGTAALLLAPLQIWIGTVRRRMHLHRRLGWAYLIAVSLSSIANG